MQRMLFVIGGALIFAVAAVSGVGAERTAEAVPTFNKDVAPILFGSCARCHRPGQVAPMSLLSYEDARPWARAIKEKVVNRKMPPWDADARFGTFRNARGLTPEEISTIAAWADGGAPQGDEPTPATPEFAEGWSHPSGRPPDYIAEMPLDFEIPAEGELPNFSIYQEIPFEEDKFLEAVEIRPGNVAATHHSSIAVRTLPRGTVLGVGEAWRGGPVISNVPVKIGEDVEFDNAEDRTEAEASGAEARRAGEEADVFAVAGTSHIAFYIPAGGFKQFWPGVGKRIRHDEYFVWGVHYNVTGKPETDRHRVGFWWQTVPMTHEVLTGRVGQTHIAESVELVASTSLPPQRAGRPSGTSGGSDEGRPRIPVIPPYDADWAITGITAFQDDVTLYLLWPHMHLRGKDTTFVVTYPDGREEVVLHVPNYDFNWQIQYELAEPLKLPAGSTIKTIGHFDNSLGNRYNPAPDKEVYWAEQSWDEMFNGWMDYSVDKLDLRLEKKGETEE